MDAVVKRLHLAAELSGEEQNHNAGAPAVDDGDALPDASVIARECSSWGLEAQLKPHQAEGVAWLIRRYVKGVNVILGDEMGLGKTVQSIGLIAFLVSKRRCPGPFLIVCPLSVTDGWAAELARFAPNLKVLKYVGDKQERESCRKMICRHVNGQSWQSRSDPALPFHVLLTTYELAMLDAKFLSRFRWRYCIIDEAQRLKNPSTILYQALQKEYMIPRRLLLTGTPVQNNLSELWSLLHFCMPLVFNNLQDFLDSFGSAAKTTREALSAPKAEEQNSSQQLLEVLKKILGAFMLRRTKAALMQTNSLVLPPMVEVTVFAPMVPVQKKVYVSVLKREAPRINTSATTSKQSLQNVVVQLRKACSHPYLFDGMEPEPFEEGEHLVEASGKLLVLDMMLERLYSKGHHVLLFAQMTRTLDIIQDYLQFRGYAYERLDGSLRAEERFAAIRSFSGGGRGGKDGGDSGGSFVFLLTTRAGGVGLNLIAADTVIFYEQDWNPQADKQALQRAHRIGQLRSVLVINIITEHTIEEVIMDRAKTKLQLTHNVIGRDDTDLEENGPASANNSELQSMIVFGLHKIVSHDQPPVPSVVEQSQSEGKGRGRGTETQFDNESDKMDATAAAKMIEMVEVALDRRVKFGSDSQNDAATTIGMDRSLTKSLGRSLPAESTHHLDHLLNGEGEEEKEDEKESLDLVAMKFLGMQGVNDNGNGGLNSAEGHSSRNRNRRQAAAAAAGPSTDDTEEAAARKKQKREEKTQLMWASIGYKSLSVSVSKSEVDGDDAGHGRGHDQVAGSDVEEDEVEYIHYLVGDCTKPTLADGHPGVIFWCVDNSGTWGTGGVFAALTRLSERISEAYGAAHQAADLNLGDLHLIPVPAAGSGTTPESNVSNKSEEQEAHRSHLWVGLAIVQTFDRRRKVSRSDISFPDFGTCVRKLAASAAGLSANQAASVHMPRIEAGNGWYMVERLLRKYGKMYRVHFNVYYFKRSVRY